MSGGGRVRDGGLLFDDGCRAFSQGSVKVSCDLILARLRLRSRGGGGRFASFSCMRNLHLSARWSESTMLSVTPQHQPRQTPITINLDRIL